MTLCKASFRSSTLRSAPIGRDVTRTRANDRIYNKRRAVEVTTVMLMGEALFALTHKASFDAISRRNASRRNQ